MVTQAFRWDKEKIADWKIARVLSIEFLERLIFLDTLPRKADIDLFGILYPYSRSTPTS
jgi:hypothetical protein